MAVHQCPLFSNNPRLMNERMVMMIEKYMSITYTYMDLSYGTDRVSTLRVVYNPDKENFIGCYIGTNFYGGWSQADDYNAENEMSFIGYINIYAEFTVF